MTDLNQFNDIYARLSKQDAAIASLKSYVERLTCNVPPMRMTFPLNSGPRDNRNNRDNQDKRDKRSTRSPNDKRSTPYPTISLSDVLDNNEIVTIQIKTGFIDGNQSYATALTVFNGTELKVTECSLVPSLINMKSSKPGEILYKFMEELKNTGHIENAFGIAPWRLCFVERNGVRLSLEELRNSN